MDDKDTIQLVEEELVLDKQAVSDARILVSTRTHTVRDFADVELGREVVDVERVAFGTVVDVAPKIRIDGDVTIIPILEERLVVEKRLVLVEELRITKRKSFRTERVEADLRKQTASVERIKVDEATEETSNG
ncbi:YsnF/AvaK domain-containing protein [Rhizobium sp. S163]|uniref:YsnF/AvaK domain-containing protein n=1 Tax=Rhizobium sp. S163 TaxID=3055039 RepID=UPI0025A9DA9D|nr:YsnF/AvaK domain-containing protein [Rhizobium sp. S163]MDM9644801.1 YsnF/AvaK domain-containing protein [Rhizobium sp. S163]